MTLEARHVTFYYKGKKNGPVLAGFSRQGEAGARGGLTAPSGRGKTTLCRLLAGYEQPNQGEILLDGRPLRDCGSVCPVQMIWQHPETALDPLLRLGDTLAETGGLEERLKKALHIEEGWLSRFPSELSGGELPRFCLARALRPEVRFLLCDEISAMLDLVTQAQIWQFLLAEAEERSLGLLVVSHDDSLLARVCTRIVELPFPSWRIF